MTRTVNTQTAHTQTKPVTRQSPANPAATDDELASQPVGYWTGVAQRAVVGYLRDSLARLDVAQPMWWTMNQVLAAGERGIGRETVAERLADVADDAYAVPRAVDQLLCRGWLTATGPDGTLHLTEAGLEAHARIKRRVDEIRAEVHEGVTDEEYVAALKVLRRMQANVARVRTGA
ncbi:MarR family transcriptional regulator [Streptomyces sp. MUM 203J]|uniref:MarR family transcriptional regulator n=1 Tax=Streptomyces sp. MUM 203J TaxID=2791990 RepID=UPI001F0364B1|nr:MarR family transcriptional regulator [Streptomyces sp. MUM 203J]MCH0541136.1 MarR family transcriptional regulator [Streptomyces sp. MUM 203J]